MTMVGLNREQRRILADKLPDMANVAVGGMCSVSFSAIARFRRWWPCRVSCCGCW